VAQGDRLVDVDISPLVRELVAAAVDQVESSERATAIPLLSSRWWCPKLFESIGLT
jgi:hypothetical protein